MGVDSTKRERALSLGWGEEQIVVIDSDQGQSAATADRIGFQNLVSEVLISRISFSRRLRSVISLANTSRPGRSL